jgi:hypothetical protein
MDIETIIEIAEDKIIADLCVAYYYAVEGGDEIKQQLLYEEIQKWYIKINKNKIK